MRKVLLAAIFAATLLATVPAFAQSPNFDPGPVWRVTYYHIKSGQADAFWKDFRENTKPIFEEFKKAGLIVDYKTFTNPVTDHPTNWLPKRPPSSTSITGRGTQRWQLQRGKMISAMWSQVIWRAKSPQSRCRMGLCSYLL